MLLSLLLLFLDNHGILLLLGCLPRVDMLILILTGTTLPLTLLPLLLRRRHWREAGTGEGNLLMHRLIQLLQRKVKELGGRCRSVWELRLVEWKDIKAVGLLVSSAQDWIIESALVTRERKRYDDSLLLLSGRLVLDTINHLHPHVKTVGAIDHVGAGAILIV